MSNAGLDESTEEMHEVDIAEIKKLKVQELRTRLVELGLSNKGNKPELVARLIDHYQKEAEEELGDELLDEDNLEESYEGDKKPDTTTAAAAPSETAKKEEADVTDGKDSKEEAANNSKPATDDKPAAEAVKKPVSQMTAQERAEMRAKRFGVSEEEAKKTARRERFGPVDVGGSSAKKFKPSAEEMEKLKARAARFGSSVSPAITSLEDDAKKQQREQRFGSVPVTSLSLEQRKQKRAAKFNS